MFFLILRVTQYLFDYDACFFPLLWMTFIYFYFPGLCPVYCFFPVSNSTIAGTKLHKMRTMGTAKIVEWSAGHGLCTWYKLHMEICKTNNKRWVKLVGPHQGMGLHFSSQVHHKFSKIYLNSYKDNHSKYRPSLNNLDSVLLHAFHSSFRPSLFHNNIVVEPGAPHLPQNLSRCRYVHIYSL